MNARDAMGESGTLSIAVESEHIMGRHPAGLPPGDYVSIRITDTGAGMDPATLRRAIEPFFTTKGPGKGTGLGLSMVHGLAAQSGGALRLESRPGAGTTAILWLPVAWAEPEASDAAVEMPDVAPRPLRHMTVLVVDDEALILMATIEMLADLGWTAIKAFSGEQALKILREHDDIDCVVTDHAMPGMTGVDLARAIREVRPGLPVILATGYANLPGDAEPDLLRLAKPYRQDQLAARVNEALTAAAEAKTNVVDLTQHRIAAGKSL